MAVRQYIGARYVPRFTGTYSPTQQYEVLDVADNGMGTSYVLKKPAPAGTPLSNTTYWAIYGASSGAVINLQNQIDAIKNEIAITPDEISTGATDYDKLQDAIDYALANKVDVFLNRDYDITGHTINYPKDADGSGNTRFKTCIYGGGIIKTDAGLMFNGNDNASDNYFFNVRFSGGINTYVLNSKIIRTFFAFCQFEGLKSLYEISSADSYIQSLKMEQCTATGMSDYFIQCNGAYDITINSCNFEKGYGAFICYALGIHNRMSGVTISNCCIESVDHGVIIKNTLDTNLSNLYFEGNTDDNIKISGTNENILISGCGLYGNVSGYCENLISIDATAMSRCIIMECFTENGRIFNISTGVKIYTILNRTRLTNVGAAYDPFYTVKYSRVDITNVHAGVTINDARFSIVGKTCTFFIAMAMNGATLNNNDVIATLPVKAEINAYIYGYTTAYNSAVYHAYIDNNGNLKQYGGNGGETYNNLILAGSFEVA